MTRAMDTNHIIFMADVGNSFKFHSVLFYETRHGVSVSKQFLIELMIPFEDAIEEAFERKKLKHAALVAEAQE